MALTERTRLYELLARLEHTDTGDRIVGMHVQTVTEILRDGEVISATLGHARAVDFDDLVELMHEDDKAALAAAMASG